MGGRRCECAIGEYVTNRSIIFPQYDLSRKKEEGKKSIERIFKVLCLGLQKRHRAACREEEAGRRRRPDRASPGRGSRPLGGSRSQ